MEEDQQQDYGLMDLVYLVQSCRDSDDLTAKRLVVEARDYFNGLGEGGSATEELQRAYRNRLGRQLTEALERIQRE